MIEAKSPDLVVLSQGGACPPMEVMATALERFWDRRAKAEAVRMAASKRIRQLVSPEPARVFSGKLKEIIRLASG